MRCDKMSTKMQAYKLTAIIASAVYIIFRILATIGGQAALLGSIVPIICFCLCLVLMLQEKPEKCEVLSALIIMLACFIRTNTSLGMMPEFSFVLIAITVWMKRYSLWKWVFLVYGSVLVIKNGISYISFLHDYSYDTSIKRIFIMLIIELAAVTILAVCGLIKWYGGFGISHVTTAKEKKAVFCPSCGAENEPESVFCVGCGVKLEQRETEKTKVTLP